MKTKEEILDYENNKPDEMCTDWILVSRSAALRAMEEYAQYKIRQFILSKCKSK